MYFRELRCLGVRLAVAAHSTPTSKARAGVVSRLLRNDDGQDLIEYVLLGSFIGLAGVVGFQLLGSTMKNVYEGWDSNVQNQWEMPSPASGS